MILALDMSTKSTGYAIFQDGKLIDYGCLTASNVNTLDRIKNMAQKIASVITNNKITEIVAEQVAPDFGSRVYKPLLYLQCQLEYFVHNSNMPIKINYLFPNTWRKTLGIPVRGGRDALKASDIKFVQDKYHLDITNDDIADAICIGLSYIG